MAMQASQLPETASSSLLSAQEHPPYPKSMDEFFANEPGLIATFDFDYDEMRLFYKKLRWSQFAGCPCCWVTTLCCLPCCLNQNINWDTESMHLSLTVDGIKYVHDKRPYCWGLYCCDRGKESKTVPYDKITDCDVKEPAGTVGVCCCIRRVLYKVVVDTPSSGGQNNDSVSYTFKLLTDYHEDPHIKHELDLEGLKNPHEFKQAVWNMKRKMNAMGGVAPAPVPEQAPKQVDMSTPLLTEIRDELRQLNATMASHYGAVAA